MKKRLFVCFLTLSLFLSLFPAYTHATTADPESYLSSMITEDMTLEAKLEIICEYVASFDYSDTVDTVERMLLTMSGNDKAGSELVLLCCRLLEIPARLRDASKDGNGTSVNVLVTAENGYYQLETGFREMAPRPYLLIHRSSLFSYSFVSGGIQVNGYDGEIAPGQTLTVPETIDGHTVVALGERFLASQTAVGAVILPGTLGRIGDDAFNGCTALTELTLPASVETIGLRAFAGCDALKGLRCEGGGFFTVKDHVLYSADMTQLVASPYGRLVFPADTVTSIRPYAFLSSGRLESVVIPAGVTEVGEGAFADCEKLSLVSFLGQPSLGSFAFVNVSANAYASWTGGESMNWIPHTPPAAVSALTGSDGDPTALLLTAGSGTTFLPYASPVVREEKDALPITITVPTGSTVTIRFPMEAPASGMVILVKQPDGSFAPALYTVLNDSSVELTLTSDATVKLADGSKSFSDVPDTHWAKKEIDYLAARGVVSGKLDGSYGHGEAITRKTLALILWRMAGSPTVPVDTRLTDVNRSDRYTQAICWAEDAGIITGYTDLTFRGDDALTRQHFAVMLWRYARYTGQTVTPENMKELSSFHDSGDIYSWAREAALWAARSGLINGRADGGFDPQGNTSRAQLAVILTRYLKKVS